MYDPQLARFMQQDTYYGDGLNLYTYVHNNPLIYVDPTGHYCSTLDGNGHYGQCGSDGGMYLEDRIVDGVQHNGGTLDLANFVAENGISVSQVKHGSDYPV